MMPFAAMRLRQATGASGDDPDFASVSLLLPMNGANNGTSFPDASGFSHSMSRNGLTPPITSTANFQWNGSSYLSNGADNALNCAGVGSEFVYAGDFTIEGWVYYTASGDQYFCDHAPVGGNATVLIVNPGTGVVKFYDTSIGFVINGGATPISLSTWHWLQLRRSGTGTNNIAIAIDGAVYQSGTSNATFGGANFCVGAYQGSSIATVGNLQDYRVTNGVARPITVPLEALPTS